MVAAKSALTLNRGTALNATPFPTIDSALRVPKLERILSEGLCYPKAALLVAL